MRTIAIMNAKGGVGKTISAINISVILATQYHKKVLLIDGDPQGNTSKTFGVNNFEYYTISDLISDNPMPITEVIINTPYNSLDLLPSDKTYYRAIFDIKEDTRESRMKLKNALNSIQDNYDFAVIDCMPYVNLGSINALTAADDVLVPFKPDCFSIEGIQEIYEQINDVKKYNYKINNPHFFITMYENSAACLECEKLLRESPSTSKYTMQTHIQYTKLVSKNTFNKNVPLCIQYPKSRTAQDYISLVREYLTTIAKERSD